MSQHEQFEVMCALAVTGQIDAAGHEELNRHLEGCADCRQRVAHFAQISAQALPLHGETYCSRHSARELTLRFVVRARAEGIPLSEVRPNFARQGNWLRSLGWRTVFAAALVAVMLIVGRTAYLQLRPRANTTASSQTPSPGNPKPSSLSKAFTQASRSHRSVSTARWHAAAKSASAVQKLEMVETSAPYELGESPEAFFGLKRPASSLGNPEPGQGEALYASNRIPGGLLFLQASSTTRIHGWIVGGGTFGGPVTTTSSGTNVVFGLLRPSSGYFRRNDTFQFFNQDNAFQSSAVRVVPDHASFYAFSISSDGSLALAQKIDIPNMFRRRERDWRERWLEQMLERLRTPRDFQNSPDLISSFNAWTGINAEKLTSEIDWHERWANTSSERLLALRNSSQCSTDPALRLNAWTGIRKPDADFQINWYDRWLKRNSVEALDAKSATGCPLTPDHTLQSKVQP